MKTQSFLCALLALILAAGCKNNQEGVPGPRAGTLKMDNLTPEQQIEKVKNDPQIPDSYKQTFINSIRAKQGQAPLSTSPNAKPTTGQ